MKNEFYYKLLNIGKQDDNVESVIKSVIDKVVAEVSFYNKNLVGLCRVVATNIAYELDNNKIDYRIVNLDDYNLYDHVMIVARTFSNDKLNYFN